MKLSLTRPNRVIVQDASDGEWSGRTSVYKRVELFNGGMLALFFAVASCQYIGQNLAYSGLKVPGVAYPDSYKGYPSAGEAGTQADYRLAQLISAMNPGVIPQGINPEKCTPRQGDVPVVMIPGTGTTPYSNWAFMGPKLANEGYCVYSFAHNPLQFLDNQSVVDGTAFMGDIKQNAAALSSIIDDVLSRTGASQVDLLGHSQGGGALPLYYLKNIMQGSKVRKSIGLAPSLGTTIGGLSQLFLSLLSGNPFTSLTSFIHVALNSVSLFQQLAGSDFLIELASGGLAKDGIEYTNIATIFDDVIKPFTNSLFQEVGKDINNIVLQDVCPLDTSNHLGLPFSNTAFELVLSVLSGKPLGANACM